MSTSKSGVGHRVATARLVSIIGVYGTVLLAAGCISDTLTSSRSSSILIIDRLDAARGGTSDDPTTTLQSDVETLGDVFSDIGQVTTRLALKDPGSAKSPTTPTSANFVTVDRYRVTYRRSDGRSTPGVDVPFAFDGAVTFTTVDGTVSAQFVLVRASSKLEPPLRALVDGGGAVIINTIADVTFYGRDQTGAAVSATGSIAVHFRDWPDADTTDDPSGGGGNGTTDDPDLTDPDDGDGAIGGGL